MIMVPPIKVNKAVASTARIKKQIYITHTYKSGLRKVKKFVGATILPHFPYSGYILNWIKVI